MPRIIALAVTTMTACALAMPTATAGAESTGPAETNTQRSTDVVKIEQPMTITGYDLKVANANGNDIIDDENGIRSVKFRTVPSCKGVPTNSIHPR